MTLLLNTISELQNTLQPLRSNKRIALVPTMGNLHQGHLSLVEQAKQCADVVIVSIFVNPTQFGVGEDFDSYPRTLEADMEQLINTEADFVFAPSIKEMYPEYPKLPATQVYLGDLAKMLCGKSRPEHFNGVGLVVSKLFNIVQPNIALFGKKDYQQLALIRQLTADLSYPIEIVGADIVRAEDGLALSSRNQYLTDKEREIAPRLHEVLVDLSKRLTRGEHLVVGLPELLAKSVKKLQAYGFDIDYLKVRTQRLAEVTSTDKSLVVLAAAWLGKTRLLDNQEITVEV